LGGAGAADVILGGNRTFAASAKNLSLDNRNENNDGVQAFALIGAEVSCSDF
jgi:hypothetical protein